MSRSESLSEWQYWVDVGGTFTDCLAISPHGSLSSVKVLSKSMFRGVARKVAPTKLLIEATQAQDGFFDGYELQLRSADGRFDDSFKVLAFDSQTCQLTVNKPVISPDGLELRYGLQSPEPSPICGIRLLRGLCLQDPIGPGKIRLGTTRGTNALLELAGSPVTLLITEGFADLLDIGDGTRADLFSLNLGEKATLFKEVIEVRGRVDAQGRVVDPLDLSKLEADLQKVRSESSLNVAICLLNSYASPDHEVSVEKLCRRMGMTHVSLSSKVSGEQNFLNRTQTTVMDAYLNPSIKGYLAKIQAQAPEANLEIMTSHGGLLPWREFSGKDSILSGPAGGAVAAARLSEDLGGVPIIALDMGGTSTDVCRYGGQLDLRHEMKVFNAEKNLSLTVLAPMIAIETVAAGGGSICWFDGDHLRVGPRSAGSFPGPACYGHDGPLTITDMNVFLGRVPQGGFPFPLEVAQMKAKLQTLRGEVEEITGSPYSLEDLAEGFLRIACANMAAPVSKISLEKGYDVRDHSLVCFGGAGGQHGVDIAQELGMKRVLIHPLASLMSAFGIGLAERRVNVGSEMKRDLRGWEQIEADLGDMAHNLVEDYKASHPRHEAIKHHRLSLDLRYEGQDHKISISLEESRAERGWAEAFEAAHQKRFGFLLARPIEVRRLRVEIVFEGGGCPNPNGLSFPTTSATRKTSVFFDGAHQELDFLTVSQVATKEVDGPVLVEGHGTIIFVRRGWRAKVMDGGILEIFALDLPEARLGPTDLAQPKQVDPLSLSLFTNRIAAIAEEMGVQLKRSALSVNIKERQDYSCAIFSHDGQLLVNAPHVPVHLGAMGETVRGLLRSDHDIDAGSVFLCNHPLLGGSHLNDVTVISPVFSEGELVLFVGNRAHHAEIGGTTPGSMPPFSKNLQEEGVIVPFVKLSKDGNEWLDQIRTIFSSGQFPSRRPDDNVADLMAQIAANKKGTQQLGNLATALGASSLKGFCQELLIVGGRQMARVIQGLPDGVFEFVDSIDEFGKLAVMLTIDGHMVRVDFTGTDSVLNSNFNCNPAIVKAAVLYAFRCLFEENIYLNEGVMKHIDLVVPEGSFLDPVWQKGSPIPAMAAGNVETSQRLVDIILGSLGVCAASQGTMNNFLFGSSEPDNPFGFYETLGGGMGATADQHGSGPVQVHMTNTKLTDIEVLEERYPVRCRALKVRTGSGGAGSFRGGDGLIREIEFLSPLEVSLIASRRTTAPFGVKGGLPGAKGMHEYYNAKTQTWQTLGGVHYMKVSPNDRLRISTPGGGGYGPMA